MPMTFLHALRLNARRLPHKDAVVFQGRRQSFSAFYDRVERMMTVLHQRGIVAGDNIAIISENHPDFLAAYFAITGLGAVPAPVNYRINVDVMVSVVEHADAKMVLLGDSLQDHAALFKASAAEVLALGDSAGASGVALIGDLIDAVEPDPPQGHDGTTIMLHTSGTTGRPKGTMRSRFGLEERAIEQGYRSSDRVLCALPICLSAGCTYSLLSLYLGATVFLQPSFDAAKILALIESEKLTAGMLLPAMLQRLISEDAFETADLGSMRALHTGGGELYADLKQTLLDKFGDALTIAAGSSEAGPYAMLSAADLRRNMSGNCVGRPFFGVELKLLDDEGNEVPQGEVGEICTRSDSRFDGYYKDEALTATVQRGDFVTVGDLGRIDEDGLLWFTGRKRDIIKSGGVNVFAPEIEEALCEHPDIREAHCIALPDPRWTELVCAVIVAEPGSDLQEGDVAAFARERLDIYKKPRRIVLVESVPRNLTGRVLKDELKQIVLAMDAQTKGAGL